LRFKGAVLVVKTVKAIKDGNAPQVPQPDADILKKAPKIFSEDCEIDWSKPAEKVYDFVRGLSPHPGARTRFNDSTFKIFRTRVIDESGENIPGKVESNQKDEIIVNCGEGRLKIEELQMEGKRRMTTEEFLKGNQI
jgi:methionyl-tRNA formyltransferase